MDDGRPQDLGRDVDADDEEEEVDDADGEEEVDDIDEDKEDEYAEEEGQDEEEEEDEDVYTYSPWSYPDSDDSDLHGISLNHLKERFELLAASLLPMEEKEVELQQGVWDFLPEEILWNILVRLPVTTQCRFRCVCSRWKLLLSASSSSARRQVSQAAYRPLCTIMSETESSASWFYSHAEDKWYQIPFQPESCVNMEWRLQAADGGLVCYQSLFGAPKWLLVCNPITGAFQVVPPCSLNPDARFLLVHFVVDKESKFIRNCYDVVSGDHVF